MKVRDDIVKGISMDHISQRFGAGTRAMYYSHDTFGLGHLRRTLTIMNHFDKRAPGISQVVVTGSPSATRFPLPPNSDLIKLPSVTKDIDGQYIPRSLDVSMQGIRDVRRDLLATAAVPFQPDFFLVDHAPAGMKGEVVRTLMELREHSPETRLIIGLRDIMDEPAVVRMQWARDGVYDLLNDVYDMIMVYGEKDTYDVVSRYGLSPQAAAKTRYVGYLGQEAGKLTPAEVRSSINMQTNHLVLLGLQREGDAEAYRTVVDAFLKQYAELDPDLDQILFDYLIAATALRLAGIHVSRENGAEVAEGMLAVGYKHLGERGPDRSLGPDRNDSGSRVAI